MKFHPLSEVFPLMDQDELGVLADDIEAHGQKDPVVRYEGMILDGRNRYLACKLKKRKVEVTEYDGDDPVGYVTSVNLHRRHLSVSQRAMIAAKLAKLPRGKPKIRTSADLSQADAAGQLKVSERSVSDAAAVLANGTPTEVAAVESGTATVKETAKQVRERTQAEEVRAAADADPKRYGDLAKELDAAGADVGKIVRELHKRQKAGTVKGEPVHDAKEQEVPNHLRDKFATSFLADLAKPFEEFVRDTVAKAKRHTKNTGPKFKHFRAGEALQLLDEIEEAAKRYYALALEARPHVLCPECKDAGYKGCEHCNQAGYLTKSLAAERAKGGRRK